MMRNKYVNFISDEHLLTCVGNLHMAYLKAKNNVTKKNFYSNKVDTIKLTFDAKFNNLDEESLIQSEILRQIDKSINNSIGTFHEQILGGIKGFEIGKLSGFDIKAKNNTLFAIFANQNISTNISDAIFEKMANNAKVFSKAIFFFVMVDDYSSTNEKWVIGHEEYSVGHKRVFKISISQFYSIVTKQATAFDSLLNALPYSIESALAIQQPS